MELYLQVGWGMMEHCRALIQKWKGGVAVLSPRDLTPRQLAPFAESLNELQGGSAWFDPQFYVPHADHARLCSHKYWPKKFDTGIFWQGGEVTRLMRELQSLNTELDTESFLLPGILAAKVNKDWLDTQDSFLNAAKSLSTKKRLIMTIALSDSATSSDDQIELLLEHAKNWDVHGFYVVCQHPQGHYLVPNPSWLLNVLDLTAGLKLQGKRVVLGYSNHQMLIAAAAKADAIVSGTWLNVRSFPPDKFKIPEDDDPKQRSTWYYCPQALTEYKIPSLDLARRAGLLQKMKAPKSLNGGYADALFTGIQPSNAGFGEPDAFRHYLHCLRGQALNSSADSFDATVSKHDTLLIEAESLIEELREAGVKGGPRDFQPMISVNQDALTSFKGIRGPMLKRKWLSI